MKTKQLSIAALALAAALTACNNGSKNQTPDGWVIKNEVKDIETIDLEQIAEAIEVIPIATDEPIDDIQGLSGSSNDFIACNNRWQKFYHIKDGRLVGQLNAVGNGPNEYRYLDYYSYLPAENLFYAPDSRNFFKRLNQLSRISRRIECIDWSSGIQQIAGKQVA